MSVAKRSAAARRRRRRYIMGGIAAMAVVVVVISLGIVARSGGPSYNGTITVPTPRSSSVPQVGHTLGDPAAPVTITIYLDFQCPFCRQLTLETMPVIEQQFVDTGVAKVVLNLIAIRGSESVQSAAAAECADDQGKLWPYHDILYENQGDEQSGAFADSRLKQFAVLIGLDTTAFDSCLDSGKYVNQVEQDTTEAKANGVQGTPTVLVNGKAVGTTTDAITEAIQQAAGS